MSMQDIELSGIEDQRLVELTVRRKIIELYLSPLGGGADIDTIYGSLYHKMTRAVDMIEQEK